MVVFIIIVKSLICCQSVYCYVFHNQRLVAEVDNDCLVSYENEATLHGGPLLSATRLTSMIGTLLILPFLLSLYVDLFIGTY